MSIYGIKTILLADDNKNDCIVFERAIIQIDIHLKLTTVTNGEELLQLLSHYVPDILFLDLEMPYKNGIQCLQTMRENKAFEKLPVVVFSATNRPNNIQVAYGFGANLFFTKPAAYNELVTSLSDILKMDWNDPASITEKYFANNQYQPFKL
jgi:CheY-like chemotaxis protein